MALVGGDAPALFSFANQMRARRNAIAAATNALRAHVESAAWVGPDREAFLSEWTHTHAPRLNAICADLDAAANKVTAHAHRQAETSG